jgi:ADP-ribosylglycohydrolase/fructose-1,6-bisphosphatase/inositol monophosphatase family enzyme
MDHRRALEVAEEAARLAGDLLRRDFHRPGGPRGGGDKAEADTEAEHLIRERLLAAFPGWGYLGEETGRHAGAPGQPVWLVDPNDGTVDYLKGRRGSAVSIGLVHERRLVLGVVFAFAYPDDAGGIFTWAEGCGPLRHDGRPVTAAPPPALGPLDVVLVSGAGDRDPDGNLAAVDPARFRSVPSIAHRLALVAAGEASATSALFAPRDWDYAGGHALLRAAGGSLVGEDGREIAYAEDGTSRSETTCGGSPPVAPDLAARPWGQGAGRDHGDRPARLRRGEAVEDPGLLSRAQGCLLGQAAGDSLGALVEDAASADEIARRHPGGLRLLQDGGCWRLLAGQPTDDTEMALALARSILDKDAYSADAALAAYKGWLRSGPFDVGSTTRRGLQGDPDPVSEANGSLMRASPLGVYAHALHPDRAAALARQDSALTHPHPVCGDSVAAFVVAIAHAVRTGDAPRAAYDAAVEWARSAEAQPAVRRALEAAASEPPVTGGPHRGWVLIALQNAFYRLLHASGVEEAVVSTVAAGGDTDTNAAIAGALAGAVHGRPGVPDQWRRMVLSCHSTGPRAERSRPRIYWPADVYEVAERLLLAGRAARA